MSVKIVDKVLLLALTLIARRWHFLRALLISSLCWVSSNLGASEEMDYWVVGSFKTLDNAERFAQSVDDLVGNEVLIQTVMRSADTLYRVILDPGPSDGDRLRTESLLRSATFDDIWRVSLSGSEGNLKVVSVGSRQIAGGGMPSDTATAGQTEAAVAPSNPDPSDGLPANEVSQSSKSGSVYEPRAGSSYHPIRLKSR